MELKKPNIWLYVACYAIWLGLCVVSFWLIVQLRANLLDLAYLSGNRQEMVGLIDRLGIILLGVLYIVIILVLEHKLRTGIEKGLLWRRALKATAILVGVIVASHVLQFAAIQWLAR